ncbi:MAG: zinc ribbon domain-containing protein [Ruminococcus sp.]|nr:zinc ribbon domain-containing protein [Ruminococcus sp.]
MFCKFCGAKIDENSAFCPKCGKSTDNSPSVQHSLPTIAVNLGNNDFLFKYGRFITTGICMFTALSPFLKFLKFPSVIPYFSDVLPEEASVYDVFSFLFKVPHLLESDSNTRFFIKLLLYASVYFIPYIVSLITTLKLIYSIYKDRSGSQTTILEQWDYSRVSQISILVANLTVPFFKNGIQSEIGIEIIQLSGLFFFTIIISIFNIILERSRSIADVKKAREIKRESSGYKSQNSYDNSWVCVCGKRNPGNQTYCMGCNKSREQD